MCSIPKFPSSKKLTLADQAEVQNFVEKFPPYSDYNFTSLYSYNVENNIELSWLNNNLVVLFQSYTSDEMFYSFLGDDNITSTAETLLNYAEGKGMKRELKLISEHTKNGMDEKSKVVVTEDHDNHDYVLSTDLICAYSGSKLRNKRSLSNRFLRNNADHRAVELDLTCVKTQLQIFDLFHTWVEKKGYSEEETTHERRALKRLLKNTEKLHTIGTGIYIKDKLVAFMINEILHDQYAMIHFDKSDFTIDGITSYMKQFTAGVFKKYNCEFINYEQDLGISGLKEAKHQLAPSFYLKKYTVS